MSASAARAPRAPGTPRPTRSTRPETAPSSRLAGLRLVPARRSSAAKAPFVLLLVGLAVAGLLGLLLLNTVVAQGSFRLHDLSKSAAQLSQREQTLSMQVQDQSDPAVLAQQAAHLGLVPGGPPVFLDVRTGRVLGAPTPAAAAVVPAPPATAAAVKPPSEPTAKTTPKTTPTTAAKAPAAKPTPITGAHR